MITEDDIRQDYEEGKRFSVTLQYGDLKVRRMLSGVEVKTFAGPIADLIADTFMVALMDLRTEIIRGRNVQASQGQAPAPEA